jgi:hypothetical protein
MHHSWIKLLLVFLLAITAGAADTVRYVDTGSAGGDGTSSVVDGLGGDDPYASLQACITAEVAALPNRVTGTSSLVIHTNRTNGGGMDVAATINGFTTDATYGIYVIQDDAPATGVWDDTKYVIAATDAYVLPITDNHVNLKNVQIQNTTTAGIYGAVSISSVSAANLIVLDGCRIKGVCSGTGTTYGVRINDADALVNAYNSYIFGFVSGADTDHCGVYVINCTTVNFWNCNINNCGRAFQQVGGTVNVVNCAVNGTLADYVGTVAVDYCCANESVGTTFHTHPVSGDWANEFTNAAAGNFTLKAGAACVSTGTADPGGASQPDTDITGAARTSPWCIGVFESDPTGTVMPIMRYLQMLRSNN